MDCVFKNLSLVDFLSLLQNNLLISFKKWSIKYQSGHGEQKMSLLTIRILCFYQLSVEVKSTKMKARSSLPIILMTTDQ